MKANVESGSPAYRLGSRPWVGRLAAVCEFVGVLLAAILGQRLLASWLGVAPWKSTQMAMLASGEVDFLRLSRLAAVDQVLRYGILLGLAFAIGWWHRRRSPAAYGLTRGGRGWLELLAVGGVLWSVNMLLPGLLRAADDHLPWIGRGPDHWALFPPVWSFEFLLYMAAGSFLLVPLVEELSFRGYLLNRLREDYADAGAVILSSVLFALVHTQYFKVELLSVGMLVSLLFGSLTAGWVLVRTGSLVPCVVAHMLGNLPPPPWVWGEEVVLAVALLVVVAARKPVVDWGRHLGRVLARNPAWGGTAFGLATLLAALGAVLVFAGRLSLVALLLLLIGLGGNALERHRARRGAGFNVPPRVS